MSTTKKLRMGRRLRQTIKLKRASKNINDISARINKLKKEIKSIEIKLRSKDVNKNQRQRLKDNQGALLREYNKIKNKQQKEIYKYNLAYVGDKLFGEGEKICKEDLEGEVKFDYCYIQTPFKTDCLPNERLIKTNVENKQLLMQNQIDILKNKPKEPIVYCPAHAILKKYGDDFDFVELVRDARRADEKKTPIINVLYRISTEQTGKSVRFGYSSRMGMIPNPPKSDKVASWMKINEGNEYYGPGVWARQKNVSQINVLQRRYPKIIYERQIGGPYAKFKTKDAARWPIMPLWTSIEKQIKMLTPKVFNKNKVISIPSATKPNDVTFDKKFLIKDYVIKPISWDGILEKYEDAKDYFKNIPFSFVIIPIRNRLFVVVDIKLRGKLMGKRESTNEIYKINQQHIEVKNKLALFDNKINETKKVIDSDKIDQSTKILAKKRLEELEIARKHFIHKNNIKNNMISTNKYLTRSCDNHITEVKRLVREMTGYDVDDYTPYTDHERAENAELRQKFLIEHRNKINK
jgi:hypothetical protein